MKQLFFNATVHTMDANAKGNAVLCEDGLILEVGDEEDLRQHAPDAEETDLHHGVLLPGFIDPHSHFSQVASGFMQADLEGVSSAEEMGRRLRQFVSDRKPEDRAWVIAKNYDTNLMPGKKNPSLAEIDAFLPDRPLAIQQKSGHMGLFNSAALSAVGITDDTPDPEGGHIGHAQGHLDGYLEENAFFIYQKKVPMPSMNDFLSAYREAQNLYASYGITTIQEGMLVDQMMPLYEMLYASNIMKLDLVAYPEMAAYDSVKKRFPRMLHQYDQHIRIGGIKIFLDGSPQGRTAWMRTPYLNSDGYCGYGTLKDEEVLLVCRKAADENVQILAHCNGDAAAQQYLDCIQKTEEIVPTFQSLRPVMIHAQLLGLDQLPQTKKLGVIPSFFVAHVYHWGDVHITNYGLERAAEISPAHSAFKSGVLFTFHQDAPVILPNMIETLWCAVNRITKDGVLLGADQRISIEEALRAVTVNAAYQYGEENSKGSIAVGKAADFAVLDRDPMQVSSMDLRNLKVLRTIKSGETIYQQDA